MFFMRTGIRLRRIQAYLVALLLSMPAALSAFGQPADTLLVAGAPIAEFGRASSISIGADGRVFVTDTNRSALIVLRQDGQVEEIIGGRGTDEGQFDEPDDVDPSNGLMIYVADAGNGRIQKFSRAFRFLESLPVPSDPGSGRSDDNPSFRAGAGGIRQPSDGLPVSVISSRTEDLYVIESISSTVIRWDRDRRNNWVIGGEDAGDAFSDLPHERRTLEV